MSDFMVLGGRFSNTLGVFWIAIYEWMMKRRANRVQHSPIEISVMVEFQVEFRQSLMCKVIRRILLFPLICRMQNSCDSKTRILKFFECFPFSLSVKCITHRNLNMIFHTQKNSFKIEYRSYLLPRSMPLPSHCSHRPPAETFKL